jgi:hypothetical protein
VTIAKRPSVLGRDASDVEVIWVKRKPEYFCGRGWTGVSLICPPRQNQPTSGTARKYSRWIPFFDRKKPKLSVFVLASVLILASVLGFAALPLEPARFQTGDSTVGK